MTPTRILLVDDYPDALDMWALYLRAQGFEVFTSADGLDAVDIATREKPDAIVMDLDLPGISGFEAAKRLRASAITAAVGLIAVTGHSHAKQHDAARASGFDTVVVKPCNPTTLVVEIRRVLAARAAS